jgi:hypothetical protein
MTNFYLHSEQTVNGLRKISLLVAHHSSYTASMNIETGEYIYLKNGAKQIYILLNVKIYTCFVPLSVNIYLYSMLLFHLYLYRYIWKTEGTENGNLLLFVVNKKNGCKWKQITEVCSPWPANDKW